MARCGKFAAKLVSIVRAVEAKQRIPKPQLPTVTYYSVFDHWIFQTRGPAPCKLCRAADAIGVFRGDQLRTWFPYHVILDVNTIGGEEEGGRGLVHPHCYCELVREIEEEQVTK